MASEPPSPPVASEPPSPDAGPAAAEKCMACRGTGQVVSHLGGGSNPVTCPWCRGGGVRLAEVDAQGRWLDGAESSDASPEPSPPEPSPPEPEAPGPAGGEAA